MPFLPPPPPWLAGRFSGLDLSAVPDGLWLAVRQYLTRMQQLDPRVGAAMAERLAGDLAAHTGTPAPHGVPPAAYLAAVVQERQSREARRAFGGAAATVPYAGPASPMPGMAGRAGMAGTAGADGMENAPAAASQHASPAPQSGREVDRPATGFVPPV